MKGNFVNFDLSKRLKDIGYNGKDFAYYRLSLKEEKEPFTETELIYFRERYDNHNFRLELHNQVQISGGICTAPMYQQAVMFLNRIGIKYHINILINCNFLDIKEVEKEIEKAIQLIEEIKNKGKKIEVWDLCKFE